jgi:hypothetical protein
MVCQEGVIESHDTKALGGFCNTGNSIVLNTLLSYDLEPRYMWRPIQFRSEITHVKGGECSFQHCIK